MISRRTAASLLAGMPFAGKRVSQEMLKQTPASTLGMASSLSGYGVAGQTETSNYPFETGKPIGPKMQEWQATRLALADPKMRELIIAAAYSKHRQIASVDPDIEVYRSFSPMAKITFQRQRNVAREIEVVSTEPFWNRFQQVQQFVQKIMWGN